MLGPCLGVGRTEERSVNWELSSPLAVSTWAHQVFSLSCKKGEREASSISWSRGCCKNVLFFIAYAIVDSIFFCCLFSPEHAGSASLLSGTAKPTELCEQANLMVVVGVLRQPYSWRNCPCKPHTSSSITILVWWAWGKVPAGFGLHLYQQVSSCGARSGEEDKEGWGQTVHVDIALVLFFTPEDLIRV